VIVLDSSAVLAVILSEPGAERVRAVFPQAVISAASLAEILTKSVQRGFDLQGSIERIRGFGLQVHPVEEGHALLAAHIFSRASRELDLSLGDRLCIALAMTLQCEMLTSDGGMLRYDAGVPVTNFR
jgi:PIN domain nuclease of toxin-antitoxin system